MLATTARLAARTTRTALARSAAPRAMSSLSIDTSPKEMSLEDLPRLDPAECFKEIDDTAIRTQLSKLREIENDLAETVSQKSDNVDWAHWESEIKYPGLVQELKAIHKNMPIPDVEQLKKEFAKETEATFDPIIAEFSKLAKEAEEETLALEKRAAEVTYLKDNIKELTVDEFLEKYPTVKASIEDDIANNRWFVEE